MKLPFEVASFARKCKRTGVPFAMVIVVGSTLEREGEHATPSLGLLVHTMRGLGVQAGMATSCGGAEGEDDALTMDDGDTLADVVGSGPIVTGAGRVSDRRQEQSKIAATIQSVEWTLFIVTDPARPDDYNDGGEVVCVGTGGAKNPNGPPAANTPLHVTGSTIPPGTQTALHVPDAQRSSPWHVCPNGRPSVQVFLS